MIHLWKQDSLCLKYTPYDFPGTIPTVHIENDTPGETNWILLFHIGSNHQHWPVYEKHFRNTLPTIYPPHLFITVHPNTENATNELIPSLNDLRLQHLIIDYHIQTIPNQGSDLSSLWYTTTHAPTIWPTIQFQTVCKIHTKGSSNLWRDTMIHDVLPSTEWVSYFLRVFIQHPSMGMIYGYSEPYDGMNHAFVIDLSLIHI